MNETDKENTQDNTFSNLILESKNYNNKNNDLKQKENNVNFTNEVIHNMYQNQSNPFIKNIIENFEKNKKSSNLSESEINNILEVLKFEKMDEYITILKNNVDSFDQFLNITDNELTQLGVKLGHRIKIVRSIKK